MCPRRSARSRAFPTVSLAAARSPEAQTHLEREIAATDRAIDQLVYQLYGLTAEEIALVEAATAPPAAKAGSPDSDEPIASAPKPVVYTEQAEAQAAHMYFAKEDPPKE